MTDKPIEIGKYDLSGMDIPCKPGDVLPNGATIIQEEVLRTFEYRRDSLVLCLWGAKYVSWVRVMQSDAPLATGGYHLLDYCCYGDYYYGNASESMEKYNKRLEEKRELLA